MEHKYPLGTDIHSHSNYPSISLTHLSINYDIDFNRKILFGYTDYNSQVHEPVAFIKLDARNISIEKVLLLPAQGAPTPLSFTIPIHHPILGYCLQIPIPSEYQKKGAIFNFRVYTSTSELSSGIQWFEPGQTFGKKYPYAYTQFEAILARTFIPCQDTPAVKTTYEIRLRVPAPLVVVGSGKFVEKKEDEISLFVGESSSSSVHHLPSLKHLTYHFTQNFPVPSYLIAFAAGAISSSKIGPRSEVHCEQEILDSAAEEFIETELFIQEAEKITGIPYLWDKYDLLMLPKAFPYGGMENPNLTFLSSSLIVGDKSLVDVVAHEISHSWSGNLVTNKNWGNFWLNEGFTMYLERLILAALLGEDARQLHLKIGFEELKKACTALADEPEFTKLVPDLTGVDPDDAFSRIPYEKGCLFLFFLENKVGKENLIEWLRSYFQIFKWQSIDSNDMKQHFNNFFKNKVEVDWNEWLYGVGLPSWNPEPFFKSTVKDQSAVKLAKQWIETSELGNSNDLKWGLEENSINLKWAALLTMYFLDILLTSEKKIGAEKFEMLDKVYHISLSKNVEILSRFILLALDNKFLKNFDFVVDFLSNHGRGVYVKPIYKKLFELGKEGVIDMEKVRGVYEKNRSFYHDVVKNFGDSLFRKN